MVFDDVTPEMLDEDAEERYQYLHGVTTEQARTKLLYYLPTATPKGVQGRQLSVFVGVFDPGATSVTSGPSPPD